MTDTKTMEDAIKLAHFKFAIIAPVIQGNFTDASKSAYYKRVTEKPLTRPDGTAFKYSHKSPEWWERLYRKGGMDALMPGVRSDKGKSRKLPDTAVEEIYRIKEKFPRLNSVQIHGHLIREGFITARTSLRCVQRYIKAAGIKPGAAPGAAKDRRAFEETRFGAMFQADSCHFPYIREDGKPRRTYLMMIIDDYSRMIVGAGLYYNDNAENFQTLLKSAVSTYGICDKLYCDHGGPYENTQLSLVAGNLGTVLLHAPVRDGAAKAKIERAFRSVKERWLYALDVKKITSLREFNDLLQDHVRDYNLTFHTGINDTPMNRYLNTNEGISKPVSAEWLDECFMNRVVRKVKRDATFTIGNVPFDAPMQFISQKVEVRFIPGRPETTCIFDGEGRFPVRPTNKAENCRIRRERLPAIDYTRMEETNV